MAQKHYSEQGLSALIAEVEKEFSAFLIKAEDTEETLAKSEESEAKPEHKEEEQHEEAPKAEAKDEKEEAKPEHKEEEKHEEAPKAEAKDEEQHDEKHAEEKPEHKEEDGHGYDNEDMDHMHKMYLSMSKGELRAHHDTIRKCMDGHATMTKSEEIEVVVAEPTKEVELLKSEVQAEKAKYDDLKKTYEAVAAIVTKLAEKKAAPAGKAITSLEVIAKSETSTSETKTLSKKEITEILMKKSADRSLTKSDRDAINAFYLNGTAINTISHLLK